MVTDVNEPDEIPAWLEPFAAGSSRPLAVYRDLSLEEFWVRPIDLCGQLGRTELMLTCSSGITSGQTCLCSWTALAHRRGQPGDTGL